MRIAPPSVSSAECMSAKKLLGSWSSLDRAFLSAFTQVRLDYGFRVFRGQGVTLLLIAQELFAERFALKCCEPDISFDRKTLYRVHSFMTATMQIA